MPPKKQAQNTSTEVWQGDEKAVREGFLGDRSCQQQSVGGEREVGD